jgi:hypothetical protein
LVLHDWFSTGGSAVQNPSCRTHVKNPREEPT